MTRKLRGELTYWVAAHRGEDPALDGGLEHRFRVWQTARLRELGERLELRDERALHAWTSRVQAVEVGPGPIPALGVAPWRAALAVDPLADGYRAEGLVPTWAGHVVLASSPGERLPAPSAAFDLAVCENALDHCEDPALVLRELRRALRPGGLLWLLVDLMTHRDELHPSPFADEARVRAVLGEAGFRVRWLGAWAGASHPAAARQCRVLAERG
ncbi:MAG: class I SAM-dependent methyltransferase [Phycisphaerales bacterium]|nr:MAG: class I SAM-dependent methyltransferase [Phycisphaerales bacterium]